MNISDLERHRSGKVIFESYPVVGYNFRMTDIQAAVGIAQLKRLPGMLEERSRLAASYTRSFGENNFLVPPYVPEYSGHTFQSYILRLAKNSPISRDRLMQELLEKGIATRRGIMCAHLEPCYRTLGRKMDLRHSEEAVKETLIIPLFSGMTAEEKERVIYSIMELVKG
jgi:dTDP-4-amino-4,6-dideoxygalactose transaminase